MTRISFLHKIHLKEGSARLGINKIPFMMKWPKRCIIRILIKTETKQTGTKRMSRWPQCHLTHSQLIWWD